MEKMHNVCIVIKYSNIRAIGHLTTLVIMRNQPKPFAPSSPCLETKNYKLQGNYANKNVAYEDVGYRGAWRGYRGYVFKPIGSEQLGG
jgi:hypothetical protein